MLYTWMLLGTIVNAYVALMSGVSVLFRRPANKITIKFGIFCSFMAWWALCYFFPLVPNNEQLSWLSFVLLHVGAIFIAVAHLDFIVHFLHLEDRFKRLIQVGYIFNLGIVLTTPTRLFIDGMVYKPYFGFWADPGPVYHIWLAVWLSFIVLSLYLLWRALMQSHGIRRKQIRYLLVGDLVTFAFGSSNFFMFYGLEIIPYFNILASGQMLLFSYVIARYRFSNIRLNLLQFLQKTLSFLLAFVVLYIAYFYINLFVAIPTSLTSDLTFLIFALILYHFFEALLKIEYLAACFHLSNHEKFVKRTVGFSKRFGFDSDLTELRRRLRSTFVTDLGLSHIALMRWDGDRLKEYSALKNFLKIQTPGDIVVFSELDLKAQDNHVPQPYLSEMKEIGEVFVPIYNEKQLTGLLVLGKKPYSNPYYAEEIEALTELCYYLAKSLAVINYHQELATEVKRKTQALRRKNKEIQESFKQLKQLDNVKDEFLSIASHELRTPLTIIKGYADFLCTQQFGPLNEKQKDFSAKILRNTNELISMINCMLDISRLESGLMQFEIEKIELNPFLKEIQKKFKVMYEAKDFHFTITTL